jgi:hypothetical protein
MLGATCFGLTGPSSGSTLFKESSALCTLSIVILMCILLLWDICASYPHIAAPLCPTEHATPLGCEYLV